MRFTRQSVVAVTPPPGKPYVIVWDEALPGFGLRVNEGGSRQWVVQYRAAGKTKRETIGRVDAIPLDDARASERRRWPVSILGLILIPRRKKPRPALQSRSSGLPLSTSRGRSRVEAAPLQRNRGAT